MMKKPFILLSFFLTHLFVHAQSPFGNNIHWLSGYEKAITGEPISYFSAFPDYVNEALLTRATDGHKIIEWETAPVPANTHSDYVYFRWVAGHSTGTSSGNRNFDLYINGAKTLVITTLPGNKTPRWHFTAADSTEVVFAQLRTDGANDAHGILYLRVPASKTTPGKPLQLKLVGEAQQSNDWFMTFKYAFEERADITSLPFLLKDGRQPLSITVLHFGNKEKLKVTVNQKVNHSFELNEGMNSFEVPVAAVSKKDSVHVVAKHGGMVLYNGFIKIAPVIQRELYFIPHSHTDIGYSHLQSQVEQIHIKNIYDALRMINRTKNYPEGSKFKWNVESLWAVENFLNQASAADSVHFFDAVKNESIGLSGLYANMMTGLSMPEEVFHYTDYAEILRSKFGLPIESAMITDVPGITWTTVEGFSKGGIKYFSDGPNYLGKNNPYLGDRVGHFVKEWGDRPVWWLSPSGKEKILFWTAGRGYSSWHGTSSGGIFFSGTKKIADYMNELVEKKYPYQIVQWRYNIVSDNGPIDTTISDFVKMWNQKYASPKIILSTVNNMFHAFEKRYGKSLPIVKGDITPYWEDGAASTASEQGMSRINSLRCAQLATLYAMLAPEKYDADDFYKAWRNIIMFTEHTWGAYNSISEPDIHFVTDQWRVKKNFMLDADSILNQLTKTLLNEFEDPASQKIAVVNTLSWPRSGIVYLDSGTTANMIVDENDRQYPLQKLSDGRKIFIAEGLKPLSTSYFYLKNNSSPPDDETPFVITDSTVTNGKVKIQWNTSNGSITKLESNGINFADGFHDEGLNSYWYVPGRDPATALSNGEVKMRIENSGPYLVTINLQSPAPGTKGIQRKISLRANDDEVHIDNIIDKNAVRTKEAVYFSFPFAKDLKDVVIDAGYGNMRYLKDQLPGSNMDYLTPRRWIDASGDGAGIQWLMKEAFMVAPDSMVDERLIINQSFKRWRESGKPTSTWLSYVMNNYWHTNFKIDQEGISQFHYALRPHGAFQSVESEKAAQEFTQPLIAFPVKENAGLQKSLFELSNNKIVVTSITPQQGGGFLIRLYNPNETAHSFTFRWNGFRPKSMKELPSEKSVDPRKNILIAGYDVIDLKVE
ncbi:MAG: glycoside hydrolase [Bacteroidetes bacterium]|nr:glycoside hydrolase [Bacteroidota bacterium]